MLRLISGKWLTLAIHHDDQRVRAEAFDAIELDLAVHGVPFDVSSTWPHTREV